MTSFHALLAPGHGHLLAWVIQYRDTLTQPEMSLALQALGLPAHTCLPGTRQELLACLRLIQRFPVAERPWLTDHLHVPPAVAHLRQHWPLLRAWGYAGSKRRAQLDSDVDQFLADLATLAESECETPLAVDA